MDNPEHAVIDEAGAKPVAQLVQELAEVQAAKDAALMAQLQEKRANASKAILADVKAGEDAAEQQPFTITMRPAMNRAERRAQVKTYARLLAETERQTPVVIPTVIPKSARRLRKGSRYAH